MAFGPHVLEIDCKAECERITACIRESLIKFRKRGVVVGVSGGIDSSVTLALCERALGNERVLALQMPEAQSAPETVHLSRLIADRYRVKAILEDITLVLRSVGFYDRYIEAVRTVMPDYDDRWRSKIVKSNSKDLGGFSFFSVVAQSPDGRMETKRLPLNAYLSIVAATNFKQRIRKMLEYYHADRENFAVAGTPNLLEYDQGFFVKLGDGAADIKPIAHLYKTQVYRLAEYLGVPEEIRRRPPTTDTYSLAQGQDEFYFSLPYDSMDLCLYGRNQGISPEIVGAAIGLSSEQVGRVYDDIDQKRRTTGYLHHAPVLVENIQLP